MKKLFLFDVDGTLTKIVTSADSRFERVLENVYGVDARGKIRYEQGNTIRRVLKDILAGFDIDFEADGKKMQETYRILEELTRETWAELKVPAIPGAEELVKKIISRGHAIGLLTGNTKGMARAKLEGKGLWKYFKIGAFGDKSLRRSDLVEEAMLDAKQKTGIEFSKQDVYIVGDTVNDIRAAKEKGVRIIAVATGKEAEEELARHGPDFLYRDFSDTDGILRETGA